MSKAPQTETTEFRNYMSDNIFHFTNLKFKSNLCDVSESVRDFEIFDNHLKLKIQRKIYFDVVLGIIEWKVFVTRIESVQ